MQYKIIYDKKILILLSNNVIYQVKIDDRCLIILFKIELDKSDFKNNYQTFEMNFNR